MNRAFVRPGASSRPQPLWEQCLPQSEWTNFLNGLWGCWSSEVKALRSFSRAFASPFSVDGLVYISRVRGWGKDRRIPTSSWSFEVSRGLIPKARRWHCDCDPPSLLRFPKSCRVATELHYGVVTELRVPVSKQKFSSTKKNSVFRIKTFAIFNIIIISTYTCILSVIHKTVEPSLKKTTTTKIAFVSSSSLRLLWFY